jgi:hypothetical protein
MVAVIECGDISELLAYLTIHGKRQKYTFAARRDAWPGAQPHLALLVDEEEAIRWLGRAQGGPIITNRERRIEVTYVEDFGSILLDDLRQRLPYRYKNRLDSGILTPATGRAVVQALIEIDPHLEETIHRLSQPNQFRLPLERVVASLTNGETVWDYCLRLEELRLIQVAGEPTIPRRVDIGDGPFIERIGLPHSISQKRAVWHVSYHRAFQGTRHGPLRVDP